MVFKILLYKWLPNSSKDREHILHLEQILCGVPQGTVLLTCQGSANTKSLILCNDGTCLAVSHKNANTALRSNQRFEQTLNIKIRFCTKM